MIRKLVHGVGELFITAGMFLLLFVTWQLWWTTVVAERESRDVTASLAKQWGDTGATTTTLAKNIPPPIDKAPAAGQVFGIIHIPRFGKGWTPRPVVQGTSVENLKHGVGHYPDTVMPGAVGNLSIAGHRTTYGAPFNGVAALRKQDVIAVETKTGWYIYKVIGTEIVKPTNVGVVAPVPGKPGVKPTQRLLTLTTCHPMYSARERFVVHAVLDSFQPRAGGQPSIVVP